MLRHGTMISTMTATTPDTATGSAAGSAAGSATGASDRRRGPLVWRRFRLLPRPLRISAYLAVLVVLLLVAGSLTGVVLVRRSFPQTSGERSSSPGLKAEVEVVRDDHGIPQIYADTTEDLMMAQGFVHAQERFYEMDVRRHATAGRLAELFGEDALETDVYVRTMGWRRRRRGGAAAARPRARGWPSTRTPRASTPTSPTGPRAGSRSSTRSSTPAASATPPSRGRRSTRWPGSRRWRGTCAATCSTRSTGL